MPVFRFAAVAEAKAATKIAPYRRHSEVLLGSIGTRVSGFPGGYAIFHGSLLVGGDVFAHALAIGREFCLVRSLY
jgi:hypothetical protein